MLSWSLWQYLLYSQAVWGPVMTLKLGLAIQFGIMSCSAVQAGAMNCTGPAVWLSPVFVVCPLPSVKKEGVVERFPGVMSLV